MKPARFALMALCLIPGCGGAHDIADDSPGSIDVEQAIPCCNSQIHLLAKVSGPDGERAESAQVTVELHGPNGEVIGPLDLDHRAYNNYVVEPKVPASGQWQATFASVRPRAGETIDFDMPSCPPEVPTGTAGCV
jgi:hypothetical protein